MKNNLFALLVFLLAMVMFFSSSPSYTGHLSKMQLDRCPTFSRDDPSCLYVSTPSSYIVGSQIPRYTLESPSSQGNAYRKQGIITSRSDRGASFRIQDFGAPLPDGKGDINDDSTINSKDCTLAQQLYANSQNSADTIPKPGYPVFADALRSLNDLYIGFISSRLRPYNLAGDINNNGEIDFSDAQAICRYVNGIGGLKETAVKGADCTEEGRLTCLSFSYISAVGSGLISPGEGLQRVVCRCQEAYGGRYCYYTFEPEFACAEGEVCVQTVSERLGPYQSPQSASAACFSVEVLP